MQRVLVRRFALPPWEEPELAPPQSIVHGRDYMLREDGGFEFDYRYLDYFWQIDELEIRARHYLDRGLSVVSVTMGFEQFDQAKYAGILRYLQRRHEVIQTFEHDRGLVVRWIWDAIRPSSPAMAELGLAPEDLEATAGRTRGSGDRRPP
jgi:hypothetical protein